MIGWLNVAALQKIAKMAMAESRWIIIDKSGDKLVHMEHSVCVSMMCSIWLDDPNIL